MPTILAYQSFRYLAIALCSIFNWTQVSYQTFQPIGADMVADAVLGQPNFTSDETNGGGVRAASLNVPWGTAIDSATGRLYVADTSNHRVLSWSSAAAVTNGQAADLVIGQPNFFSNEPNQGSSEPNAGTLNGPIAVTVDNMRNLYVADQDNNRVLIYANPAELDTLADWVVGQPGFTSSIEWATASGLRGPWGVVVDRQANLYVSDSGNHRVLQYRNVLTSDQAADRVFGQPNFTSVVANNGGVSASSLFFPAGVTIDQADTLYIADSGNHRVLVYYLPLNSDQVADRVFGQPNFTSNAAPTGGVSATTLRTPTDVALDRRGNMYVTDFGSNRVLVFNTPANGDSVADYVFGQPSFSSDGANVPSITAGTLHAPAGIDIDQAGNVYVADTLNSRILRYDTPIPFQVYLPLTIC